MPLLLSPPLLTHDNVQVFRNTMRLTKKHVTSFFFCSKRLLSLEFAFLALGLQTFLCNWLGLKHFCHEMLEPNAN